MPWNRGRHESDIAAQGSGLGCIGQHRGPAGLWWWLVAVPGAHLGADRRGGGRRRRRRPRRPAGALHPLQQRLHGPAHRAAARAAAADLAGARGYAAGRRERGRPHGLRRPGRRRAPRRGAGRHLSRGDAADPCRAPTSSRGSTLDHAGRWRPLARWRPATTCRSAAARSASATINGDGRNDLALFGADGVVMLMQQSAGGGRQLRGAEVDPVVECFASARSGRMLQGRGRRRRCARRRWRGLRRRERPAGAPSSAAPPGQPPASAGRADSPAPRRSRACAAASSCAAVSTPSATTLRPRLCAMAITACVMAVSSPVGGQAADERAVDLHRLRPGSASGTTATSSRCRSRRSRCARPSRAVAAAPALARSGSAISTLSVSSTSSCRPAPRRSAERVAQVVDQAVAGELARRQVHGHRRGGEARRSRQSRICRHAAWMHPAPDAARSGRVPRPAG